MTVVLDPYLDPYIQAVKGKKAFDIVLLDVRELTTVADLFIICSGRSTRQVSAIAEFINVELKKEGKRPLQTEGRKEGNWVLLDYGDVVIHIFFEPVRTFYDLEGLWSEANRIDLEDGEEGKKGAPPVGEDPIIDEFIE